MRRLFPRTLRVCAVISAAVVLAAQTQHITPFTGTWKLNVAKSKFNPGPPFRSFVLTFTRDGTRNLDLIGADGQRLKASLPRSNGKEVAVMAAQGMEKTRATSKMQGRVFDDTWKQDGKVIERVHAVVSPDGQILAITVNGTDKQGRAYRNQLTFEKAANSCLLTSQNLAGARGPEFETAV